MNYGSKKERQANQVYIREYDMSHIKVPECQDFIVYIFKKENNMRVKRLY